MARHINSRGALTQRSDNRMVDPLHNFVPDRNLKAKQNTPTNARGGLSQGPSTSNVQVNLTPTRCSQRRLGVVATPLSLPENRHARPNTPKTQNQVRRFLIPQEDNDSSDMRHKEPLHERRLQSPDADEDIQSTPSVSRALLNPRRSLSNRSQCNSPQSVQHNLELNGHISSRNPSLGESNSHDNSNREDEATTAEPRRTRGNTCLSSLCKRKKYGDSNPVLQVLPNKAIVGLRYHELSLAIGMWVRQRENFPLNASTFKDVREKNVDIVVQLARDHYQFVPDNEFTKEVLRERIRLRYNGYRSELSAHYRNECRNDYEFALANPPKMCTNREDWTVMCKHFSSEEFQKKSALASQARKKQVLKHSNGPKPFAQTLHDMALNGEAIDPVTLFEVTHTFKHSKDPTCENIKKKMKAMKEKADNGELDMSLEDIYQKNLPSTSTYGKKRRRREDNSFSYFSKTEEQLAVMQDNLDEANSARANQAKEIERLKRRLKKKETKMMQYFNQCLISLGKGLLSDDALDSEEEESEREVEEEREGSLLGADENLDRGGANEELGTGKDMSDNMEDQHSD